MSEVPVVPPSLLSTSPWGTSQSLSDTGNEHVAIISDDCSASNMDLCIDNITVNSQNSLESMDGQHSFQQIGLNTHDLQLALLFYMKVFLEQLHIIGMMILCNDVLMCKRKVLLQSLSPISPPFNSSGCILEMESHAGRGNFERSIGHYKVTF